MTAVATAAVALNEAAHAVVSEILGLRVYSLTLADSPGGLTCDSARGGRPFPVDGLMTLELVPIPRGTDRYVRNAIVCLAGDVAESLGAPPELTWVPGPADRENARLSLMLSDPTRSWARSAIDKRLVVTEAYAVVLVTKHWSAITHLAGALARSGSLTGEQVRGLL